MELEKILRDSGFVCHHVGQIMDRSTNEVRMGKLRAVLIPIFTLVIGCFIGVFGATAYISKTIMVELAPALEAVEQISSAVEVVEQLAPVIEVAEQLKPVIDIVERLDPVIEMVNQLSINQDGEDTVTNTALVDLLGDVDMDEIATGLASSMAPVLNAELEGAIQPLSDDFYVVLEEFNTVMSKVDKLERRIDSVLDEMQQDSLNN